MRVLCGMGPTSIVVVFVSVGGTIYWYVNLLSFSNLFDGSQPSPKTLFLVVVIVWSSLDVVVIVVRNQPKKKATQLERKMLTSKDFCRFFFQPWAWWNTSELWFFLILRTVIYERWWEMRVWCLFWIFENRVFVFSLLLLRRFSLLMCLVSVCVCFMCKAYRLQARPKIVLCVCVCVFVSWAQSCSCGVLQAQGDLREHHPIPPRTEHLPFFLCVTTSYVILGDI